jgi:hypothetical protein
LRDKGKYFSLDAQTLYHEVRRISEAVEGIKVLHLAGGEPFSHNDMHTTIKLLSANEKIKKIEIVTNGTVTPNEETIKTLRRFFNKVIILVSDYGKAKVDNRSATKLLHECGLNHQIKRDLLWRDKTDISFKKYDNQGLINIAAACATFRDSYFSLIDGIVTAHCPTSGSLLYYLGLHQEAAGFYFSLREIGDEEIADRLYQLNETAITPICQYCVPTHEAKTCIPGEQLHV